MINEDTEASDDKDSVRSVVVELDNDNLSSAIMNLAVK